MAQLIEYVERFLALLLRIALALEALVKQAEPPVATPIPAPVLVMPPPPPMPTTSEKIILQDDFSAVESIPDPKNVPDGYKYHWAAGDTAPSSTSQATTTIQRFVAGFYAAVLAVAGVLRDAQQGARAFFVTDGRWDALTPWFRKWIRVQVDFYLSENWQAGSGAGYFTTLPWEVKRASGETASVQVNIDESGVFWLKMPFGSGDRSFYAPAMPPVKVGWNHLELRMLLDDREDTGRAEIEFEGVVIQGTGAVSHTDGTSALALTLYSNAVSELSVPVTNVLMTEIAA